MTRPLIVLVACLTCLFGLSVAAPASAQTTCPIAQTSNTVPSNAVLKITFCAFTSDNINGANVYGLPAGKLAVNNMVAGTQYGDGKTLYQGTIPPQPVGVYSITVKATNLAIPGDPTSTQEGPTASNPFVLTVVNASPPPGVVSSVYIAK